MEKKNLHESTQHTQLTTLPCCKQKKLAIFLPIIGVRHTKSRDFLSLEQIR